MNPHINIITLGVLDLKKSTEFYQNGLGFPKLDFNGNISFFTLNGSWLSLYPWELLAKDIGISSDGGGFRRVTLAHNVKSEEEVEEMLNIAVIPII